MFETPWLRSWVLFEKIKKNQNVNATQVNLMAFSFPLFNFMYFK